ncbi:LysR family transcriptional regulator [Pelagimonas varians]|uniref:Glycine cleavage system transcriptional activator n=1 Tax=Pelagimonas varians TaxID=696760 RepID=A0A238KAH4_9RHOB|nr:LysR family transcriptional regulator [Pelagimonas varians]PYG31211.1 LysR family transcriptional regulator [Pelagimonas varians]SMX39859.1 Glycine cleavage system transcriptional activator [Pelagimonas varians]
MSASRRFTPPLSCLTAFEAVARHGSVTDAARELDLTQSAVSRQIQKLESQVGGLLFERDRKRLHVTAQGETYAREIRMALAQIQNATIALQTNPDGGVLNLASLPSIGTHWLAPRLPAFLRAHPGITLNMSTRFVPVDFSEETAHAAIQHGQGDWPRVGTMKLWDEQMLAVAAPDLLQTGDAATLPRLQLETRPQAWADWFAAQGLPEPGRPAMVVDQFGTMLRAAQAGLGLALMPDYLVAQEIGNGSLLALPGAKPVSIGAYYLVWPENAGEYPALVAFRDWLRMASATRFMP